MKARKSKGRVGSQIVRGLVFVFQDGISVVEGH